MPKESQQADPKKAQPSSERETTYQAYLLNEKGEEIPITEEMMADSMSKIKLKSIGAHTGYSKAITPDMLQDTEKA